MALLETIITGALAGFVANFGARYIYALKTKPQLEYITVLNKKASSTREGEFVTAKYYVGVKNSGSDVANSCKAQISIKGNRESTETLVEPAPHPDGADTVYDEDVIENYIIEESAHWDEHNSPTRLNINRNETCWFLFLTSSFEYTGAEAHRQIIFGDDDHDSESIRIEQRTTANSEPIVNREDWLEWEIWEDLDWQNNTIRVTSANSSAIVAEFDIEWETPNRSPEVSIIPQ